ncbi:hypothetical protein V1514DRAFT_289554 [Lipomyces japonicus]|uniref:uncharacterized protein n=1 Tax=Lipomyces japonicus TaxID=56871 RepID=UPI0034CE4B91
MDNSRSEIYIAPPTQVNVLPSLAYDSSPNLNYSDSESDLAFAVSDHFYNYSLSAKTWSQKEDIVGLRPNPAYPAFTSKPVQQQPFFDSGIYLGSGSASFFAESSPETNDIFRLPLQSIADASSPLLSHSPVKSEISSLDYSDYQQDLYAEFRAIPSHTLISPYVDLQPSLPSSVYKKPHLHSLSSESEYDATYSSDALSSELSSFDDGTDFSSPELTSNAFPSPKPKQNWSTSWQPILTSDPVTNKKKILPLEEDLGKLPSSTLDKYVIEPSESNKKYVCAFQECGKTFGRRYNIRTHIQTHLSDRPHPCSKCGSRFVRQHDLRRHERIHDIDKPFLCPCGKSFARHDAMARHQQRKICSGVS